MSAHLFGLPASIHPGKPLGHKWTEKVPVGGQTLELILVQRANDEQDIYQLTTGGQWAKAGTRISLTPPASS